MSLLLVPPAQTLTDREVQIMDMVANASPNGEIAVQLNIKPVTVKRHLSTIFDKTGMSNRTELAVYRLTQLHKAELLALGARQAA